MKITFDTTSKQEVQEVLAYLQSLSADPITPAAIAAQPRNPTPPPHTDADAPPLRPEEQPKAPAAKAEKKATPKAEKKAEPKPEPQVDPDNVFADKTGEDLRKLAGDFLSNLPPEPKARHRIGIVEGILKKQFNVTSSADLGEKDIPKAYELIFNYIEDNA